MISEEVLKAEYWALVQRAQKEDLHDFRLGWMACLAYVTQINDCPEVA